MFIIIIFNVFDYLRFVQFEEINKEVGILRIKDLNKKKTRLIDLQIYTIFIYINAKEGA